MNVANLLRASARAFPDRPALSWRGTTLTYADLDARSARFAEWLGDAGAARGRIVLFLDNRPDLLVTMFGAFRSGGTVVPCNSRLTTEELAFIVEDCDVAVMVTDEAHRAVATAAATASGATVIVAGDDLDDVLASSPATLSVADVAAEDIAWIFYTSGTTGRPKGAMLSHAVLNFCTVSWLADLTPLDETDVTLHAAPLSHGAGFHALAATARAAHQIIPDSTSFDPAATLELIRDRGVTNTWFVPTQIVMLTEAVPDGMELPTLRHVVYGGAPMTPAATTRALERFGPIFVQLYGQGETPMTATVLRRQDHVPELLGSAGRPRPGIEVAIMDTDGRLMEPGEVGEVVVRGPSIMSGYWNRPDATAETIVDGWLHTGDLGRMNERDVLFLLDRSKDLIISGGSNVYAVEVEQVLSAHPSVGEVAVVGLPDDLWGEVVVAVVVPNAGVAVEPEALTAFCRERLAGYKLPRRFVVQDSLPRNAYGKVLKRELRSTLA